MLAVALALAGAVLLWLPAFRYRIDAATCATWPALVPGSRMRWRTWRRSRSWRSRGCGRQARLVARARARRRCARARAGDRGAAFRVRRSAVLRRGRPLDGDASRQRRDAASSVLPADDRFLTVLPESWRGGRARTARRSISWRAESRASAATTRPAAAHLPAALGAGARSWRRGSRAWRSGRARRRCFCSRRSRSSTAPSIRTTTRTSRSPWPPSRWRCRSRRAPQARRGEIAGSLALAAALAIKLSAALLSRSICCASRSPPSPSAYAPHRRRRRCRRRHRRCRCAGRRAAHLARARRLHRAHRRSLRSPRPLLALVGRAAARALHLRPAHSDRVVLDRPRLPRRQRRLDPLRRLRAARDRAPLVWAAIALFVYYLCLHAFLQAWYLLPLLGAATQLPDYMTRPFRIFVVCLALYYALAIPRSTATSAPSSSASRSSPKRSSSSCRRSLRCSSRGGELAHPRERRPALPELRDCLAQRRQRRLARLEAAVERNRRLRHVDELPWMEEEDHRIAHLRKQRIADLRRQPHRRRADGRRHAIDPVVARRSARRTTPACAAPATSRAGSRATPGCRGTRWESRGWARGTRSPRRTPAASPPNRGSRARRRRGPSPRSGRGYRRGSRAHAPRRPAADHLRWRRAMSPVQKKVAGTCSAANRSSSRGIASVTPR